MRNFISEWDSWQAEEWNKGDLLKDAASHPSKCKIGNSVLCTFLLLAGPVFVEDVLHSEYYENYCLLKIEKFKHNYPSSNNKDSIIN